MVLTPRGIRVGPPLTGPIGDGRPVAVPEPDFVVVTGASLEGAQLAVAAVESLVESGQDDRARPPRVEVQTPYPRVFAELVARCRSVRIRHSFASDATVDGCSFVVRRGPGAGDRGSPAPSLGEPWIAGRSHALLPTPPLSPPSPTVGESVPAETGPRESQAQPPLAPPAPRPVRFDGQVYAPPGQPYAAPGQLYGVPPPPNAPPIQRLSTSRRRFLALAVGAVCVVPLAGGVAALASARRSSALNLDPPAVPTDRRAVTLADIASRPLLEDAWQRRASRFQNDPAAARRVDEVLSRGRYSVAVFGWGEEHGETYADLGGSISVLSFNIATGAIDTISLSRDIRTPEIERVLAVSGTSPQVLRRVFRAGIDSKVGGFQLMRTVVESMTGLLIDHQVLFKDVFVKDFVDFLIQKSGRKLSIQVDKPHTLAAFRLGGVDYPAGTRIEAGPQEMTSAEAMRYILAEDAKPQGKQDERSYRKMVLFRAILAQAQPLVQKDLSNNANPFSNTLLDELRLFLDRQERSGQLVFEWDDFRALALDLFSRGYWLKRLVWKGYESFATVRSLDELKSDAIRANAQLVIHDPYFGDGGVRRVHNIRDQPAPNDNPGVTAEVRDGILKDPALGWMLIPEGGDPYAPDLVTGYWGATRALVRKTLTSG